MQLAKRKKAKKPPATIVVPPEVFVAAEKPDGEVCFGVKFLSAAERASVIKQAKVRVDESPESTDRDRAEELALMRCLIAESLCSPNDCEIMAEQFPTQEHVFLRLTEGGAKHVFDAIQAREVELSPRFAEASAEDLEELLLRLSDGEADKLGDGELSAVLRHLRAALDIIRAS